MPRKKLYFYAGILTILLYSLGFFTGIYISQKTSGSAELSQLSAEIETLKTNLENIQLQQLYITASETAIGCSFLVTDINKIQADLGSFYQKLPQKLEVYESSGQTNEQYEEIKREYMLISLRVWMLSAIAKDRCNKDIVPVLYFYSKNCTDCIEQGNVLDRIRNETANLAIFTIDLNLDEQIVKTIRDTYSITRAPALVINNKLYEGFINYEMLKVMVIR